MCVCVGVEDAVWVLVQCALDSIIILYTCQRLIEALNVYNLGRVG